MSRFIPAGQSDLSDLKAKEASASSKYQQEEEDREAPSLYEQMRLNHMEKEREYQEKVKARNQPHKIDEREHQFYESLRKKRVSAEDDKKRELKEGLEAFEQVKKLKSSKESTAPDPTIKQQIAVPRVNVIKKRAPRKTQTAAPLPPNKPPTQPKNKNKTTGLVDGYSSSDSDSE